MGEIGEDSKIQFGVFELDLRSRELRKAGARLKLQDQPLKILIALLEQPGELVTREQLKRQIWPEDSFGDFDHAVNIAVAKLRAVLTDSSDGPRFIETLPRRGYRFICPVSKEGEISGGALAAAKTELKAAERRPLRWVAAAGTAIVIAGLAASAGWLFSSKKHRLGQTDTIVLANFANTTGDPIFTGTLKEALATTLGQSPFFSILSEQRERDALRMMGRAPGERITPDVAREICQRTGSTVVLAGSIAKFGSQYVIGLNAMNCATGDSLAREEAQASRKEDVLNSLGTAARKLRASLGESVASIRKFDTPVMNVTTSSLEAMKTFAAFVSSGGTVPGLPMLRHAVELDPNFAIAYKAISDIYSDVGDTEMASAYAQKAYDRREGATEPERLDITSTYYFATLGDLDREMSVYLVWKQMYPRDAGPWINSSEDRENFGDYDGALKEAQQAVRLAPHAYMPYVDLASAFLSLNRRTEARQTALLALERGLDMPDFHLLFYRLAFLENNTKEMEAEMKLLTSEGEPLKGTLAQSGTEAYFGRLRNSRASSKRGVEAAQRAHLNELAAQIRAVDGLREAEFGNAGPAKRAAKAALALSSGRRAKAFAALLLARTDDARRAQALADKLKTDFPSDTLLQRYWLPTIRGSIELARKNPAKALDELQSVSYELGDTGLVVGNLYPVYVRGQAYLAAREGKEAAAEFQTILDHRSVVLNSPLGALAHLGLARASALQARTSHAADADAAKARARAAYQDFLTLWKDADPDLPVLKQAEAEYGKIKLEVKVRELKAEGRM